MKHIRTYIKQSNNGITGHVYEHVVANHVVKELSQLGYKQLLHYELNAHTYDGIVVIEFETYSMSILRKFNKLLANVNINAKSIKVAVGQIESEYERKSKINLSKLSRSLRVLRNSPWVRQEDFGFTKPIDSDDARKLTTHVGGFDRKSTSRFNHFDVTYVVEDCSYELKTLAVYVVQIVALNYIDQVCADFESMYDAGDEWAEYQDTVGYSHTLTAPKSLSLKAEMLEQHFISKYAITETDAFIDQVCAYIKRDITQPYPYFSHESIFAKSYQLVGTKVLKQTITRENIRSVIKSIRWSIS